MTDTFVDRGHAVVVPNYGLHINREGQAIVCLHPR